MDARRTFVAYLRMCAQMADAINDLDDRAQVMADMQVGLMLLKALRPD